MSTTDNISNEEVLQQNMDEKSTPGGVFMVQLLFEEVASMPAQELMNTVMKKHLGEVDNFTYNEGMAGFAVTKYLAEFQDAKVPPQVMIMGLNEFDGSKIGGIERSQMWDCAESEEVLSKCRYQIIGVDMLAAALHYKERAELDMDFTEALLELFPTCKAVYFQNSGKLFYASDVRNTQVPREYRFVNFAVNVRFFNILGTNDMMVDSVGMHTLFLPDLQYHFHDFNHNWVINHAYNVLYYIFDNESPIESGDPIDGVVDGFMSREVMWRCNYEMALIQPVRQVIDICMNEYASGVRDE